MVKKSVAWFLVFAFLSLVIAPDFVSAAYGYSGSGYDPVGPVIVGGVVVLGLIVWGIVALVKKHPSAPTGQPQEQKQEAPQSLRFEQQPDEQLITPSGQIALLMW